MGRTLRLFVAVPIPEAVAVFLERIQRRIGLPKANLRWVKARNIHLTLRFLGDIDAAQIPRITAGMDAAAASARSFSLQAQGLGVFPNLDDARVLWVGLSGEMDRLDAIQKSLEAGLESFGFGRDTRGFRAHLTIGRVRRRVDAQVLGQCLESIEDTASESFRVDRVGLIKSVLKPTGAEYSLLHASPLDG